MSNLRRLALAALLPSFCVGLAGCATAPAAPARTAAVSSVSSGTVAKGAIGWKAFGPDAFAQAKAENKLVLVDVGIEGCSACRWMHEGSYRDPEVVRRLSEHFVPVSIDADTQPDLGERFEEWGWPATIVLTGDGVQVFALRGSRAPKVFAEILDDITAKAKAGTLKPSTTATTHEPPVATELDSMCRTVQSRLDAMGDDTGWGGDERIAFAPPIEHAFLRARAHGETRLQTRALGALGGQQKLLDPVWGGVYVAALTPTWERPIVEKRIMQQAHALEGFAVGFHATGDARWRTAAMSVHRYLKDWMLAPDGTFYSTQQDDAPNLPATMSAEEYYQLSDEGRRRYGTPPVDHGVYTDQNGATIAAYARLYEATGDRAMLDIATRAASVILRERQQPSGAVLQFRREGAVTGDDRIRQATADGQTYLKAQAELGLGLVALGRVTGDPQWADAAVKIARATREQLEDGAGGGGFFAANARSTDTMLKRRKPFGENVQAARFLNQLAVLTKNAEWRALAERTLRATATPAALADQAIWGIAPYALLLDELASEPIEITVVTSDLVKRDPRADALFARAVRLYEPRKVVRFATPGTYPDRGKPALYVCTTSACSRPVVDAEDIAAAAAPFIAEKSRRCSTATQSH